MKLLCLGTGKDIDAGDDLRCVAGILTGHLFKVTRVVEPTPPLRYGAIEYTVSGEAHGNGPQQSIPRVFDCIWIGDDSLVLSVTFDNEHSLSHVIDQAVAKMCADGRDVRSILVGEREWDQLRDLATVPAVPSSGPVPELMFGGIRVMRLQHRDHCLAFEHAPMRSGDGI